MHAALTVLERWGTMSFEEVSARAIDYAEQRLSAAAAHGADASTSNCQFIEKLARTTSGTG